MEQKKCSRCKIKKEDTELRADPYALEVWNDDTKFLLCDDCSYELAMDI